MAIGDITRTAVELALSEFDTLGRVPFLAKYGFSDAKRYWIAWEGKLYPSKAIAGVAHRHIDGQQLLPSATFTGGEGTVVRRLKQLGFEVRTIARNPPWVRDELILALDLYFKNSASPPRQNSKEVAELSDLLNKMHRLNGAAYFGETLRNPNGVYLKMMNFRALDPAFTSQGKVGMQSGGALEKLVWKEYLDRHEALAADAYALKQAIALGDEDEDKLADLPAVEPYEGEEGGVIVRLHKRYERDPRLVAEKRKEAKLAGKLVCEACEFDFGEVYGALGLDFIEVHHIKPVHQMKPGAKTKLADLALLCSNCHRMAHRKRLPLSVADLRSVIDPN